MDEEDLRTTAASSAEIIQDELSHRRQAVSDPGSATISSITDGDLAAMRAKFPFLRDFSDNFIRTTKPDSILKMETTTMKMKESERTRDADERLAAKRADLGVSVKTVKEGKDDRWKILHEAFVLEFSYHTTVRLGDRLIFTRKSSQEKTISCTRGPSVCRLSVGLCKFVVPNKRCPRGGYR
jgi:hypothetical protein